MRSIDAKRLVNVLTIDFTLDHLNLGPEPVFPGNNPIVETRGELYYADFLHQVGHYDHVYIPVKRTSHALNTRTYWTFILLKNIGLGPGGWHTHWIVLDSITISTGKPLINWNTRIHPTDNQINTRYQRARDHRLRPLPRLYKNARDPFRTSYNSRPFVPHPDQHFNPLL